MPHTTWDSVTFRTLVRAVAEGLVSNIAVLSKVAENVFKLYNGVLEGFSFNTVILQHFKKVRSMAISTCIRFMKLPGTFINRFWCSPPSNSQRLIAGCTDGFIRVYDAVSSECLMEVEAHPGERITSLSVVGELVATAGLDGYVCLWDQAINPIGRFQVCQPKAGGAMWDDPSVAISPTGNEVAVGLVGNDWDNCNWPGQLQLWSVHPAKELLSTDWLYEGAGEHVAWTPDGRYIATCSHGVIRLLDRHDISEKWVIKFDSNTYGNIGFKNDGRIIYAGSDDYEIGLRCFDVDSGILAGSFFTHENVLALGFSPRDHLMATGHYGGRVCVFKIDEKSSVKVVAEFFSTDQENGDVVSVAFSADGRLVAAAAYRQIVLWDLRNHEKLCTIDKPIKDNWEFAVIDFVQAG